MCYTSFISVQFITLYVCVCVIPGLASSAPSSELGTQDKYFLNERTRLDLSLPHHKTGLEEWAPRGAYWYWMLLEHLLCARLDWGQRLMRRSAWPK